MSDQEIDKKIKRAIDEAIDRWLDKKFNELGRWSFGLILAATIFVIVKLFLHFDGLGK